ncbi:hypothetical protein DFR29_10571 [Tahibacter aquaticus]|uniref:Fibronectin type-III domain-containing protein n=1 Tax=Tahibacter aquaticus TaxID=520092 RepID=A0A4R6Z054_9GAMM|nr:hypothetical protein [Tahibacter aquaticus]TDR44890.1 hypothetical protein DFR29_10571 [Tahibacter aquaticus]
MNHLFRHLLLLSSLAMASTAQAECKPPASADGKPPQHRVHWTTRSEIQSASFDVFRGDSADGEFRKINPQPIPAAKNSIRPREYAYEDTAIDPCKAYFYYVEAVSLTGYRVKLSAPQQAGPKAGAPPAPSPAAPSH